MTLEQTIPIVMSLVGGGAAGAIINQLATSYRNRLQPIGFRYESTALFSPPADEAAPNFRVTFTPPVGTLTELTNVHALRIDIVNRGNHDRAKMTLGLSIPPGQGIVHAAKTTGDRHHKLKIESELRPDAPSNEIDLVLEPFNRGDLYTVTLYVTLPPGQEEAGPIEASSPEAVRFVELPTASELAVEAIGIGGKLLLFSPIRLKIG